MVWILLLSALGVAVMVGSTWALGGLRTAALPDLSAAEALLRRDLLDFEAEEGLLSVDGTAALLAPRGGDGAGLVFAMGERFATRLLSRGDVLSVADVPAGSPAGSGSPAGNEVVCLELRFSDFTHPSMRVELPAGASAARWRTRLAALCDPLGREAA